MNTKDTENTISKEKLDELKEQAREILSQVRQNILVFYPFIGAVSMRLDLVPIRDIRVRTACTDGRTVYFDLDFLASLNKDEKIFVLAHEIWHVVMMHMLRLQNRRVDLFNVATDCEVNYLLSEDGLTPPNGLIFPEEEWKGKSAEEIYEILLKKQKNGDKGSGCGNNKTSDQQNCGSGKLSGQFDKHDYGNSDETENAVKVTDRWGDVGLDDDFKPSISKDLAEKIRESVVSAAQQVERSQGSLPAHIKRVVDTMEKPEIRWQEELSKFVSTTFNNGERTWIPPNRRYVWKGLYLPSVYSERVNITVAIDTSGSTSNDISKFLTELKSLMESFGNYSIRVIQCDAEVTSCEEYESDSNPYSFDNDNMEISGGGGTSFVPVFEYMEERGMETDALIYLTDGYGDAPKRAPAYPVLWIVTACGTLDFCEWGKKIQFKKEHE